MKTFRNWFTGATTAAILVHFAHMLVDDRVSPPPAPPRYKQTCYEWAAGGEKEQFKQRFYACIDERVMIAEGGTDGAEP